MHPEQTTLPPSGQILHSTPEAFKYGFPLCVSSVDCSDSQHSLLPTLSARNPTVNVAPVLLHLKVIGKLALDFPVLVTPVVVLRAFREPTLYPLEHFFGARTRQSPVVFELSEVKVQ